MESTAIIKSTAIRERTRLCMDCSFGFLMWSNYR